LRPAFTPALIGSLFASAFLRGPVDGGSNSAGLHAITGPADERLFSLGGECVKELGPHVFRADEDDLVL
jgi:hypothetical protein